MSETWYVMEDGAVGDPLEIAPDDAGTLRHKDGRAVAYAPHGPRSRMVSAEEAEVYRCREMTAGKPATYKTRKAR